MPRLAAGTLALITAVKLAPFTPQFITEMGELGYDRLRADELLSMRIHNVDAEFVMDLRERGFEDLTVDQLVAFKMHGIDPGQKSKRRR